MAEPGAVVVDYDVEIRSARYYRSQSEQVRDVLRKRTGATQKNTGPDVELAVCLT